jgi:hypothetical protein
MTTSTAQRPARTAITVELPEAFTPTWNRIDGITVIGTHIAIDPQEYFFRYESPVWIVCDWPQVVEGLLGATDTTERTVEQQALEFVMANGRRTTDPAEVLTIAYQVAAYLFRDEHLADPGLAHVTPEQMRMLREATTLMALNKVTIEGHLANVGPCWFFPVATSVVFGLDEEQGRAVDELYHGGFFNEGRRVESVLAHAALGGRLVHACQALADMMGGVVLEYGTDLKAFRADLGAHAHRWMAQVEAMSGR